MNFFASNQILIHLALGFIVAIIFAFMGINKLRGFDIWMGVHLFYTIAANSKYFDSSDNIAKIFADNIFAAAGYLFYTIKN